MVFFLENLIAIFIGKVIVCPHKPLIRFHCTAEDKLFSLKVRHMLHHTGSCFSQLTRDAGIPLEMTARKVHRIAAEKFVSAFTRQNNLDILCRILSEEVQRNFRRVGKGFIHIILDFGRHSEIIIGIDLVADILNADDFGEILCVGEFRIFFFFVSNGEGLDVLGALGNLLHDIGRVDTT